MMQFGDLSEQYICLVKRLYADQSATALTDVESDEFEIARGQKQGDFLSSFLFNSVLQSAMEKDTGTWNEKVLGIKLGEEKRDCISKPRFADDVLLMANSLKQLKRMMTDFTRSTEAQGLEIHSEKTKILTNQKSNRLKEIEIDGIHVEILPLEGKVRISGTGDHIHGSRSHRGKARNPLCVVRVRQTSTGIDIQVLLTPTKVTYL